MLRDKYPTGFVLDPVLAVRPEFYLKASDRNIWDLFYACNEYNFTTAHSLVFGGSSLEQ